VPASADDCPPCETHEGGECRAGSAQVGRRARVPRLQRVAAKLTCPRVDATSAYQTGLPWRPQICIMRCGSCPLKPAVEGRRSRKPHSPGPTPTSVPDSDRFPSGNCHATDRTCSVYGCNGLGRTHAAFPEAYNTLWEILYLSTLPHPATEPLDSLLVCPAQERLDLLEGFVGRV
jgi:hypothetical protein